MRPNKTKSNKLNKMNNTKKYKKYKNYKKYKMNGGENCPDVNLMQCMNNPIPFSLWNKMSTNYLIKLIDSPDIDDNLYTLSFSSFGFGNDLVVYNRNGNIQMSQSNINCVNGLCTYKNNDNSNDIERKFYIYEPITGVKEVEQGIRLYRIFNY